jgi:hypothetical protein
MPELPVEEMTQKAFDGLPHYSFSLPTATTIGKVWKAQRGDDWIIGEYVKHNDPGFVGIQWRKIIIKKESP